MNWKFWKKDDDPLSDLSNDFSPPSDDGLSNDDLGLPPANDPLADMQSQQPPSPQMQPQTNPQQFSPDSHPQGVAFQPSDNQPATPQQSSDGDKTVLMQELILARLDNIKTQLDTINQRLTMLENKEPPQGQERGPWYANR